MIGIITKKIGMTKIIKDDGSIVPTTILKCDPNVVSQIKTVEKDGYEAVVLAKNAKSKPSKTVKFSKLKEFKVHGNGSSLEKGSKIGVDLFQIDEQVKITSKSKGKGFQGVVKRWNMHGGPASHGSHFHREPGSVGARAKPGKIHPGKKLAGHMGNEQKSVFNKVVFIDKENNLIGVKGSVPGSTNSYVYLTKTA